MAATFAVEKLRHQCSRHPSKAHTSASPVGGFVSYEKEVERPDKQRRFERGSKERISMNKLTSAGLILLAGVTIIALLAGCGGNGDAPAQAVDDAVNATGDQVLIRGTTVELLDASGAQTGRYLTIPDAMALPGQTVHLLVNLSDIGSVAGFEAHVNFDRGLLTATDVAVTDAIPGSPIVVINTDNDAGTIAVVVAGLQEASSGSVTLLDITFTVAAAIGCATTNIGISVDLVDGSANTIGTTLNDSGTVNIRLGYLGDMNQNGEPNVADVIIILRIIVGLEEDSPQADCDEDGQTGLVDAVMMIRCVVGLDDWPIGVYGQKQPVTIVATTPQDGATGVDPASDLTIVFSTEVDPGSLAYTCSPAATFTATWNSPTNDTVTLEPGGGVASAALAGDTTYTISGIGVTPVDTFCYEALTGGQFSFTTAAGGVQPEVEITSPADGATVSGNFDVTVAADANPVPSSGLALQQTATITKIDVTFGGVAKTISGSAGTVTFNSLLVVNGSHEVTAVATSSNGRTGADSIDVTVDNFVVYVGNATVASGATFTATVNLADTTGVAGFGMTVNYDQTKLELVGGDAAVAKGEALPGSALLIANTATPGVISLAVAGMATFDNARTELLTIEFQAIGAAGPTVIDIDDTAGAPTRLLFADAMATPIDPQPTAVDGTVTIQ